MIPNDSHILQINFIYDILHNSEDAKAIFMTADVSEIIVLIAQCIMSWSAVTHC